MLWSVVLLISSLAFLSQYRLLPVDSSWCALNEDTATFLTAPFSLNLLIVVPAGVGAAEGRDGGGGHS